MARTDQYYCMQKRLSNFMWQVTYLSVSLVQCRLLVLFRPLDKVHPRAKFSRGNEVKFSYEKFG